MPISPKSVARRSKNTTNQFEIRNSSEFADNILIHEDLRYQGEDYLQDTPERSKHLSVFRRCVGRLKTNHNKGVARRLIISINQFSQLVQYGSSEQRCGLLSCCTDPDPAFNQVFLPK